MTTDIDRLHDVLLHGGGPGSGKTHALCHTVAGALEVNPDEDAVVVVPQRDWMRHVTPMLCEVLKEHGFHPEQWGRSKLSLRDGRCIYFIVADHQELLRGHHGPVIHIDR